MTPLRRPPSGPLGPVVLILERLLPNPPKVMLGEPLRKIKLGCLRRSCLGYMLRRAWLLPPRAVRYLLSLSPLQASHPAIPPIRTSPFARGRLPGLLLILFRVIVLNKHPVRRAERESGEGPVILSVPLSVRAGRRRGPPGHRALLLQIRRPPWADRRRVKFCLGHPGVEGVLSTRLRLPRARAANPPRRIDTLPRRHRPSRRQPQPGMRLPVRVVLARLREVDLEPPRVPPRQ